MSKTYILFLVVVFAGSVCWANTPENAAKGFTELVRQRTNDACVGLTDSTGHYLVSHNINKKMLPASILKIPLANAAMNYLTPGFKFKTEIYTDEDANLIVKGYGDPFLISEEIGIIAKKIRRLNYKSFRNIIIDSSAFLDESPEYISNTNNPYDAVNGALVVNFNTVYIGKDEFGNVFSAEPQTPLTDVSRTFAYSLGNNTKKRFNTGKHKDVHEQYVTELFSEIFARNGIYIQGSLKNLNPQGQLTHVLTHNNTKSLRNMIAGMMEYSNNFIANQIMAIMGAEYFDFPTDLSKGVKAFNNITREILPEMSGSYHFAEGSGLSRENRVTCRFMIRTLLEYMRFHRTLPFKSKSYYKTGSLNGVNNVAGYVQHKGKLFPFVLILYTRNNERFRFMGILENLVILNSEQ